MLAAAALAWGRPDPSCDYGGDAQTGICIMQMEAGLDTGPVLLRGEMAIDRTDTTQFT